MVTHYVQDASMSRNRDLGILTLPNYYLIFKHNLRVVQAYLGLRELLQNRRSLPTCLSNFPVPTTTEFHRNLVWIDLTPWGNAVLLHSIIMPTELSVSLCYNVCPRSSTIVFARHATSHWAALNQEKNTILAYISVNSPILKFSKAL